MERTTSPINTKNWKIEVPPHIQPEEGKEPPLIIALVRHLNNHYDFRHNVITEKIEYKGATQDVWQNLNDSFINSIIIELKSVKVNVPKDIFLTLFNSKYIRKYDPIRAYFDSLPVWDGSDSIKMLAQTVKTQDDAAWHFYLEKWLVSMVKSAYFRKSINQQMLVFYGRQGVGKTRWLMKLLPKELKNLLFTGYTKFEDQMFQAKLARYMIIFLDELDSYAGRMQALLKSFLTQEVIKIRPLYSSLDTEELRISSFVGTINHESFLADISGSRRFLVNEVLEINHEHKIPIDKVYAHAFALARDPAYRHYFNEKETKELENRNERFKIKSDAELLITQYYEPCTSDTAGARYISATQIFSNLQEKSGIKLRCSANSIGGLMKHLGFLRGHTGSGDEKRWGWLVKEKD